MKITAFLLLIAFIQVSAESYSQSTKLNLTYENVKLSELLDKIEKASEYRFFYDSQSIDMSKSVTVDLKNSNLNEVLDKVLSSDLTYEMVSSNIVVIKSSTIGAVVNQQASIVSGRVTDSSGEPLPGVTVLIKGTTQGAITDIDGNYTISNVPAAGTLVFSFLGMRTQEVVVGTQTSVNIIMQEQSSDIDEVLIVAYGTQKKINITGSVQQVSGEILENRPIKDVGSGLIGTMSGLSINQSSGAPNSTVNFNIRGYTGLNSSTTPLILVDGVEQDINQLNPEDVESVSILKDAAASAIYGSRAPFGIILITTKKGKPGDMKINYKSNYSWAQIIGHPDPINSVTFANSWNEAFRNSRKDDYFTAEQIQSFQDFIDGTGPSNILDPSGRWWDMGVGNSNWIKEIFKPWQFNTNQTLSMQGGLPDDKLNYYASVGYLKNSGLFRMSMKGDEYKRYNSNINISSKVNHWFKVGLIMRYARRETIRPSQSGWTSDNSIMNWVGGRWPTMSVYNPDGGMGQNNLNLYLSEGGYETDFEDDLSTIFNMDITPLKGLTLHGSYSWDSFSSSWFRLEKSWTVTQPNGNDETWGTTPSSVYRTLGKGNYHQIDASAKYEYDIKKHSFKILAGYQEESSKNLSLNANKKELITVEIPSISTAIGDAVVDDTEGHWSTRGYYYRFNYIFNDKYMLELNGRYDASSRFPSETRWAFFPSISAGWNIAKEIFWPVSEVSMFKIRGSYGALGNQNVTNYLYLPNMSFTMNSGNIINGKNSNYIDMPAIVNDQITWTKPVMVDIGVDITALNNRLDVSFDWYLRTIYDQIGPAEQMPKTLGTNPPPTNNVTTATRGWDMSLKWKDDLAIIANKPLRYNVNVTLSDYIGYVVDYENNTGSRSVWTNGQVFGDIYGYKTKGIAQSVDDIIGHVTQFPLYSNFWYPGDLLYEDIDGNGKIDGGSGYWDDMGDHVKIGNSTPRFQYGLNLGFNWNNFNLTCLFEGLLKQDINLGNNKFLVGFTGSMWQSSIFKQTMDWWTPDNTNAFFPRPYMTNELSQKRQSTQSRYIVNGAYLRFKNLQLGYTHNINKFGIDRINVYGSVENVGVIYNASKIKYDPVILRGGGSVYPLQRVISLGLNIYL